MTRLAEIEFLFKWERGREQIFGLFAESCTFLLGAFPFHITIHGLKNTLWYLNKYKEISIKADCLQIILSERIQFCFV